ncbi:MAG: XRE family transcriptional regulator [Candidatus Electrothrix sp. AW2]|jgi:DNA-binding XRE family transcriptional regulator|nr:XRE family transcriptional regulator [Candidatus Electrothrix sp. AX1]MCI5117526.1 XRE family transcriptional regulator [Candidatus Electrothrix gigas]MCI5128055.1 XRE family transcriptional regulator [Candidatus Electrothrix gigas]MCI5134467.1 XRE family transcriptional regulator [Candidatus Electrothrix gigas]MCI5179912.1 XRE family transcriptional regulator [Candidatus Electrothrix gigas]
MTSSEFSYYRKKLGKTQKSLSGLLGVSIKAVQSYEQGWRGVPLHIERKLYFLLVNRRKNGSGKRKDCWTLKKCDCKKECPAWEYQAGHLCWFLNGTLCTCTNGYEGKDKMEICRSCEVLTSQL